MLSWYYYPCRNICSICSRNESVALPIPGPDPSFSFALVSREIHCLWLVLFPVIPNDRRIVYPETTTGWCQRRQIYHIVPIVVTTFHIHQWNRCLFRLAAVHSGVKGERVAATKPAVVAAVAAAAATVTRLWWMETQRPYFGLRHQSRTTNIIIPAMSGLLELFTLPALPQIQWRVRGIDIPDCAVGRQMETALLVMLHKIACRSWFDHQCP